MEKCKDCKGTGKYVGLHEISPCKSCHSEDKPEREVKVVWSMPVIHGLMDQDPDRVIDAFKRAVADAVARRGDSSLV